MIEVEQQFAITQAQADLLLATAVNVVTLQLNEVYFDTADFAYLKQDIWIRKRNSRFELKRRSAGLQHSDGLEQYEEYADDTSIKKVLKLDNSVDLEVYASTALTPSIRLTTIRKSFEVDSYHVDIDFTDFGYIVCEIERQAEDDESREGIRKHILSLAIQFGLSTEPARNKAKEYIVRTYPALVAELVENGVLQ